MTATGEAPRAAPPPRTAILTVDAGPGVSRADGLPIAAEATPDSPAREAQRNEGT